MASSHAVDCQSSTARAVARRSICWADVAQDWFNREVGRTYVDRRLGFYRPSTEQPISIPDLCF